MRAVHGSRNIMLEILLLFLFYMILYCTRMIRKMAMYDVSIFMFMITAVMLHIVLQ